MGKENPVPVSPLDDTNLTKASPRPARQVRWTVTDGKVDLVRPVVPPRPLEVAAEPQDIVFDLARSAVIVIDMQNDFLREDGWLGIRGVDFSAIWKPVAPFESFPNPPLFIGSGGMRVKTPPVSQILPLVR